MENKRLKTIVGINSLISKDVDRVLGILKNPEDYDFEEMVRAAKTLVELDKMFELTQELH